MSNITIRCACGQTFDFTDRDQEFYKQNNFERPKRCQACRLKKKQEKQQRERPNYRQEFDERAVDDAIDDLSTRY